MISTTAARPLRPLLAVTAAGLLAAGCSSGGSPKTTSVAHPVPDSPAPVSSTPTVTGTGRLPALPMRAYMVGDAEGGQLQQAEAVLVRNCMKGFGFDYAPPALSSAGPSKAGAQDNASGDLPVTDPGLAATQGYRDRSAASDRRRPRVALSEQGRLALTGLDGVPPNGQAPGTPGPVNGRQIPAGGCLGEARRSIGGDEAVKTGFGDPELVTNIVLDSYFKSISEPRVRAVFARWSACMRTRGFRYPSPVEAAKDPQWDVYRPPSAREIETAKADVECKRQHNVSGVFHAVQQAFQQAAIERNAQALQKIRTDREAALVKAARIIAAGR